ncbi:GNAT family N-acetyltransferase [Methylobacterium nigriterrae]|uniref:GNAT family N-acetyltransferase n=1 Tax=Methylobacterium nigriterrae TaxID=3127512 RepID=UPI003D677726
MVEAWWRLRGELAGEMLHVITARRAGRLVAVAPLAVTWRYGLRFLRWVGSDVFDYCDILAADERASSALWRAIHRCGGFDLALIKTVQAGTATNRWLAQSAKHVRSTPTFAVRLSELHSAPWLRWSSDARFRKKTRRLVQKGVRYEVLRAGPVPERVFTALISQKTAWAARQKRVGLCNDPEAAGVILRGIAEGFARAGVLHLSWLECDEGIIAVHLGCVHAGRLYYFMKSYDAAWSPLSPGAHLLAANLVWSAAHGLNEVDFLRGSEGYKAKIANVRRSPGDFLFAGSLLGRLAQPVIHLVLSRSGHELSAQAP